jgi:serine protease Do
MALGLTGLGIAGVDHLRSENAPVSVRMADPNEPPSRTGFGNVVEKVSPAVVNISASKVVKSPTGYFRNESFQQGDDQDQSDDPSDMLRQFFGGNMRGMRPQEQRERGLGSGVIVSSDGYILTNNHVVDGATDIHVALADKREYKARVVGTDPKVDIAVVKIDAANLPAIVFGDSNKARVGDYAIAVGDPFGVGQTVTMGIVSAKGRTGLGIEQYEDFIQTDAPINPGNSGGALVNDRGELIGINTAILSHGSEGGNQGIGFAIPANLARSVMDQIVKYGKVQRAYIGIVPQDVTPAIAEAFGTKSLAGALVGDVTPDSPAQRAGLKKGDIILNLNGKPVNDANDLRMTISMMQPGSAVQLTVMRDGATHNLSATLGDLPGTQATNRESRGEHSQSALAGVSVDNLDAQTARQLHLPANTPGVVVTNVSASSPAADQLQRGDVIQEVNRKSVTNTQEFEQAVRASKHDPLLLVNRQGNTMYVVG